MTTRVKNLNRYQKGVLLLLAGMTLLFTALYLAAAARKGVAYQNAILTPVQVGRETVYSGKIQGEPARFTVYADRTVLFQYGGQTYGPYTIREDPSAVPQASELAGQMTGVELSCGGQLLFRGGVLVCALTAASILFADEWFRFSLAFRIRGADRAEPSDWEIAGRYLSWTALPVLALALFIGRLR